MSTSNDLYASASFSFDADKAGGSFSGHNSTDEDLPNAFGDFVHNNRVDDQDEIAAKQESRKVRFWRNTILSLLMAAAIVATAFTYFSFVRTSQHNFEVSFNTLALSVQDEAQVHWKSIVEKTVDISELVTTDSKTETWPFVTLRSWDSYAKTETSTFFDFIAVCPLVLQKDLKAWTERTGSSRGNNTGATDRDLATNIQKHYPIWKLFPVKNELVNTDAYSLPQMQTLIEAASNTKGLVVGEVGRTMDQLHNGDGIASNSSDPDSEGSILIYPVFEKLNDASSKMVAIVSANLNWRTFFGHLLPSGVYGVFYVLQDSCGSAKDNRTYTYVVNKGDSKVTYLGVGDYHESKYDYFAFTLAHADSIGGPDISPVIATGNLNCSYVITVYPSTDLASLYSSTNPIIFCSVLTGLFVVMAVAFFAYDKLMQETNIKIIRAVAKTNAFVSSMFPANFHKRLFDLTADPTSTYDNVPGNTTSFDETRKKRQSLSKVYGLTSRRGSNTDDDEDSLFTGKPIADLYPETTIMLADLVGFTAWSSVREPSQVFILLETIFRAFDEIAVRRRIFKVETVGDCYVAVAGLPDPRKDHALVMAKFARDCIRNFGVLAKKLERTLGPDTGDLGMRIGLHSGPITGGILRGERSRFQLFGDTINTAARMESNSTKNRVQLSEQTAELLFKVNKGHWLIKRTDKVNAKGKGNLQTYWLDVKTKRGSIAGSVLDPDENSPDEDSPDEIQDDESLHGTDVFEDATNVKRLSSRHIRLVDWNVECLVQLLRKIAVRREAKRSLQADSQPEAIADDCTNIGTVLDEVKECIEIPEFHPKVERMNQDVGSIELNEHVKEQLRDYVTTICCMYKNNNHFHNFEHASHVAMSVLKLISRVISPLEVLAKQCGSERRLLASKLHDNTFGLTSDPLTLFACAFSALIHDVDHPGVPNSVLIEKNDELAKFYKNKSVLEQHSVDISWALLMEEKYTDLRVAIISTKAEKDHFRQIVVNCVMATDIMDKDLKEARNQRWRRAFSEARVPHSLTRETYNRKATIVIELLIQASDIAHTMQHWHIYCKWNERLYKELLSAFLSGRTDSDPSQNWFEGELRFFDFHVIPLAKKLKDCGVFGVSSDEYLNYALSNRQEWESKGREVVCEMKERCTAEIIAYTVRQSHGVPEPGLLSYKISDQFGPDGLFSTTEWSRARTTVSALGPETRPPSPSPDDDIVWK